MQLNALLNPTRLKALYNVGTSIALESGPGLGKSTVVRQMPTVLSEIFGEDFGYAEQLMPTIDAPDWRGFNVPTKEDDMLVSRYTYPAAMPMPEYLKKYPRGIAFLDEFAQSDQLLQKAASATLLERRIGEHQLPEGWLVISASNRMSDKSGVVKPMMHNINRVRTLQVEFTLGGDGDTYGWVDWARENKIHPMGIAFAMQNPGVIYSDTMPTEPKPFCTPRSFVSAMRLLQEMAGDSMNLPNDGLTQELVMGDIGEGAAATFFGFIKVADQIPTIQDILNDPDKAKLPKDHRMDACMTVQQLCLHHIDEDNVEEIWRYIERLPKELQVVSAKTINKMKGNLLMGGSKRLTQWVADNRALIMTATA